MRMGGHDPEKVHAAYRAAVNNQGTPTVILARTIKGYGLGESGEGKNANDAIQTQKNVGNGTPGAGDGASNPAAPAGGAGQPPAGDSKPAGEATPPAGDAKPEGGATGAGGAATAHGGAPSRRAPASFARAMRPRMPTRRRAAWSPDAGAARVPPPPPRSFAPVSPHLWIAFTITAALCQTLRNALQRVDDAVAQYREALAIYQKNPADRPRVAADRGRAVPLRQDFFDRQVQRRQWRGRPSGLLRVLWLCDGVRRCRNCSPS